MGILPSPYRPLWTDNPLAKRRTSAKEDLLWAYGCSRGEKLFTLISKAGPNVVECVAILTEFVVAPRERWA